MDVKFFVDNNIGRNLVDGLRLIGYKNIEHLTEHFAEDTEDEIWLKYVGDNRLVLLTKDKMIRRNPKEKEALLRHKVVAFYLGGQNMGTKEISKQLLNAWDKIEHCAKIQLKQGVAGAFIVRPRGGKIDSIPLT